MKFLVNTKLKRKLFSYVFTHSDESFYVRELAGLIDEDPGNLSRELRKLEEEGLFYSVERANAKFYSLNKNHPLFSEIKKIVLKTEGVAGRLKDLLDKYNGISLAFIYGSYARGTEKKGSDVDLILVGEFSESKITRELRSLEHQLNREMNFTPYTQAEFEKESQKQGSFLNEIVQSKIILLKGTLHAG